MRKAQANKTLAPAVELSELTLKILNGQMKSLPKVISLNIEKANEADYHALFQLVRYRSFGHKFEKTQPGASPIQLVRNCINSGEFSEALKLALKLDPADPEVRIEIGRSQVFLAQYEDACESLKPVVGDADIPANTRGVAAQLMGHALMDLGRLDEAKDSLDQAQTLAQVSGNTVGSIAVHLFHSRIAAFEGRCDESLLFLDQAFDEIAALGSFRWLLGYYRHRSHASYFAGSERCLAESWAAISIARTLGDELFESRGILEMVLMARKFEHALELGSLKNKIETLAERSQSDFRNWVGMIFSQASPHQYSAQKFLTESQKVVQLVSALRLPELGEKPSWIYDPRTETLVSLTKTEFSRFPASSPIGKILIALQREKEGMDASTLFEEVWNLNWCAERHQNLLDVTLHRFNRIAHGLKILRNQGSMRLSDSGVIL